MTSSTYDAACAKACTLALTLYADHPELGFPYVQFRDISYHFYGSEAKAELATTRRALSVGNWDKEVTDTRFILRSTINGVTVRLYAERDQVCEKVVTGTETIETEFKVCPACEGNVGSDGAGGMVCLVNGRSDYYAPALKSVIRTDQIDKVEWQCLPVLSAKIPAAVTA